MFIPITEIMKILTPEQVQHLFENKITLEHDSIQEVIKTQFRFRLPCPECNDIAKRLGLQTYYDIKHGLRENASK